MVSIAPLANSFSLSKQSAVPPLSTPAVVPSSVFVPAVGLCAGLACGLVPHALCASEGDKAIISPTCSAIQYVCVFHAAEQEERRASIGSSQVLFSPPPSLSPLCTFPGSFLESSELLWVTFDPKASQTGGPNGSAFPSRASDLPLESFSAKAFSDHDLSCWRGRSCSPLASGRRRTRGPCCLPSPLLCTHPPRQPPPFSLTRCFF